MIHYIQTQEALQQASLFILNQSSWGIDTETTGLDPITDKVILLQIGNEVDQFVINTKKVNPVILKDFFENSNYTKLGHNLKFDYKMIKSSFGISVDGMRCTFLAEKILTNGLKFQGFGLNDLLELYLQIKVDKTLQKSFVSNNQEFTQEQIQYAAIDVQHLLPLGRLLYKHLATKNLLDTWVLESNAIPVFGDMELEGVLLEKNKWNALTEKHKQQAQQLTVEMNRYAEAFWPMNLFGEVDINYGSPQQVVKLLNKMGAKVKEYNPNTKDYDLLPVTSSNDETLKKIVDSPLVKKLKAYRTNMVMIDTFGNPYIEAIHPKTGRIHCNYDQIGTETGRIAKGHSTVNFLNIPRDKERRNCIIAPEDYVIETDDFSGCELRIWAHISQDPGLCGALVRGEDLHCYVASKLYNKTVTKTENKELRTPAKSINFGIAYGMSANKLFTKLNGEGFPITLDEAKALFDKYCKEFKVGVDFLRASGKLALKQGYLQNLNGRTRHWLIPNPKDLMKYPGGAFDSTYRARVSGIEREGGNFLIQSVNADITKLAMICIRNYILKHKIRSSIIMQVYDEIVTCTHKDDTEHFHKIKVQIMQQAASRWINSVPIEVDSHVLPYWTK